MQKRVAYHNSDTQSGQLVPAPKRMHSLDALRATAMLNVVLIHAAMSFAVKGPAGWAALDRSRSYLFDVYIFAAVGFTVQLFFVMAGLFAALLLATQGAAGFARSRFWRIGVPFIISLVILVPIMQAVGLFGSSRKAAAGIVQPGFWVAAREFFTSSAFFKSYSLGHLWFLWYLLLLYAALLVIMLFIRHLPASALIDRWFASIFSSPARPFLLALPTMALMYPMSWMIDTPVGVVPELRILAYYAFFFVVGMLLARQPQLLGVAASGWRVYLALALVVVLPMTLGLIILGAGVSQWRDSGYYQIALACYALYTWLMMFGLIGLFRQYASRPLAAMRYLSEASFWVYLAHFPVVLLLQILIKDVSMPAPLKFLCVVSISALILLGSYELCVRRTFVGAILNGRRLPKPDMSQAGLTLPQAASAEPEAPAPRAL